jgi:microcin C transport system permease protein
MAAYFARRFLLMIPTFFGITFLVFAITQFVPGGPLEQIMMNLQTGGGESGASGSAVEMTPEAMAALKEHFNLDKPFYEAYGIWLWNLLHFDMGISFKFNKPVADVITQRFPVSMYFGLIGFFLAYLVCIPLGVLKAVKHGSKFDIISSFVVFAGYSIPGFALGAVLLMLLGGGSFWDVFPLGGFRSPGWSDFSLWHKITDQVYHTILPVLSYAVASFATLTVLMKNSLMENLGQDYVRTAFAKGLSERSVIVRHALRNSLIPICTGLGHAIGIVMAGSYLVEKVFNINGIGYLGYTSIIDRDYAVVMGILVINTLLVLIGNILSDVLYVIVDPRIRFS